MFLNKQPHRHMHAYPDMCVYTHTQIYTHISETTTVLGIRREPSTWGRGTKRHILWASIKYGIITETRPGDAPGKQEFSRQPPNH